MMRVIHTDCGVSSFESVGVIVSKINDDLWCRYDAVVRPGINNLAGFNFPRNNFGCEFKTLGSVCKNLWFEYDSPSCKS